jgi:hypothetical protein
MADEWSYAGHLLPVQDGVLEQFLRVAWARCGLAWFARMLDSSRASAMSFAF